MYYENCLPIVDALREANDAIASLQGKPQGVLRVTAPVLFVQYFLAPILPEFLLAHPDLRVILNVANERRDVVKEGYDLAIRVGQLEDSTFMMRSVSSVCLKFLASPTYLKQYGEPGAIADLKTHCLLGIGQSQNELTWTLQNEQQETETLRFRPRLVANDLAPIYQAVLAGLGIGLLPEFLCQPELTRGGLVKVLLHWSSKPVSINAIYPSRKYLPKKVKVFLEFLEKKIRK